MFCAQIFLPLNFSAESAICIWAAVSFCAGSVQLF